MSVPQVPSSDKTGGSAATGGDSPVAATAKPSASAQLGASSAPVSQPPALFGGHKGGGKRRKDGLIAGSPEAKAADRERDAARKRSERASKKGAALPPALPSASVAAANAPDAVPAGESALPGVAAVAVDAPPMVSPGAGMVAPAFVPWTERILMRPIRLLTRIIDRIRCSSLMVRVRKLGLKPDQEKKIEESIKYKQEALDDFNTALSNCLAIELNKRRIAGAQHSHLLDVAITGGELIHGHLNTVDMLERMFAENEAEKKKAEQSRANKTNPAENAAPLNNSPEAILKA